MYDAQAKRHENSGLWFSPQPRWPRVLEQRNTESVLFDVHKLDKTAAPKSMLKTGPHNAVAGSGLIDLRTLVEAGKDFRQMAMRFAPTSALLAGLPRPEPAPMPAVVPRTPRFLLVFSMLLLAATATLLALAAFR
jgi:hypothetical protein